MNKVTLLLTSTVFAASVAAAAPGPSRVPLEHFFENPAVSAPRLSDDGQRVVMLVAHESGRQSLAQLELATRKASLVVVPSDYDVDFAVWKDERIVFGGDAGGNESYALRSIRPDGKQWQDLNESYDPLRPIEGPVGANIVSLLRNEKEWIMTLGYGARRTSTGAMEVAGSYGYYRLNVRTGRRLLAEAIPEKTLGYFVDRVSGERYGRAMQTGGEMVLELRAPGETGFRTAARLPAGEEKWTPVGLTPDGQHCLIIIRGDRGFDRGALVEFDLRSAQQSRVAFVPPEGEIAEVVRGRRGEIWGVRYEAERSHYVWFDATLGQIHGSLQATFPGRIVDLVDQSQDANRFLIFVHSDRDPGAYYVYDRETVKLIPVGKVLPKIDPALLAAREPIVYTARDGLKIHGYLTRPSGRTDVPSPLILLPHGGPYGLRDSWGFDAEAQFLANRGYAVLQVNYRGSGGYGDAFQQAGRKEWGGKMQDDLTDAVQWAITQKITTPDRVGIMGGSYGGYATLAGLVYTPDLYRCGINVVGVSDLRFLSKTTRWRGRGYKLFTSSWIGDDAEYLRERSPVNFVERIRVPTLHAYGENDPRVDIQHWRVLEAALKRYDKPYEYLRDAESGHGFQDEAVRLRLYQTVEAFLARNLPVEQP